MALDLLPDELGRMAETADRCFQSDSVNDYEQLDILIHELENRAREMFQESLRGVYESIAEKLEDGAVLSGHERGALELLIVGEAKYHVRAENKYREWKDELQRIIAQIRETPAQDKPEAEMLLQLRGLCHDAKAVLPEIELYLRDRERVKQFHDAMNGDLLFQERRFLAHLIRQLIASERR
jgi:hypothetical protein